jgi:hypothetical protein
MANTLLNPKVYANVMLKLLKNNLVMGKLVTTEHKNEFKKVGNTIYVKRPPRFTVRNGSVANAQDIVEGEVPVVLDTQRGIDLSFTSVDLTLNVDQLLEDATMNEAAAALAQDIDTTIMTEVLKFNNWVGTPGETIDTALDYFKGPERLDDMAVPQFGRNGILSVRDHWALASSLTDLNAQGGIAGDALTKARLPLVGSVQPYMTQGTVSLTTGTRATSGAAQIAGAGQTVAYTAVNDEFQQTLTVDGLAAGATVKAGEVFAIAGVYAINPRTRQTLDFLQQFVVLADATADGAGAISLIVAVPIISTGAYQTVSAAPADNAAITFMGAASTTYRQNATFLKSAISLVFAKLVQPASGEYSYSTDPETGVNIRYWRTSDGTNDTHLHRWDVLFGTENVDPRLGTRISGTA